MSKATKIEYETRIFKVQGWIIEGVQPALIIKQITDYGWCDKRQAERLLKAARERWIKVPEAKLEEKRQLKIAQLAQLRRGLKEEHKGTPAGIMAIMAIEKQIIQLEGLVTPLKVEHTGKDGKPIETEIRHTVTFKKYGTGDQL